MRILPAIIITIALISPHVHAKQSNNAAEKSWRPFFAAFRAAVKKRDRAALKKMMVPDFFFSGGGGDDNGDGQTRDEAFEFWDDPHVRGWQALDRTLAQGTVPMAAWWDQGKRREYVSRVGPPAANIRRNLTQVRIDWYAVFEFRDGNWYCTFFVQCCD